MGGEAAVTKLAENRLDEVAIKAKLQEDGSKLAGTHIGNEKEVSLKEDQGHLQKENDKKDKKEKKEKKKSKSKSEDEESNDSEEDSEDDEEHKKKKKEKKERKKREKEEKKVKKNKEKEEKEHDPDYLREKLEKIEKKMAKLLEKKAKYQEKLASGQGAHLNVEHSAKGDSNTTGEVAVPTILTVKQSSAV